MHTHVFNTPVQETIDALQTAIGKNGMLLLCHINGQANAAKIGEAIHPVRVLEVFRPELAVRVWRTHPPAGIDIPVRLYVYENPDGKAVISYRPLSQEMATYNMPELSRVGHEADEIFVRILRDATAICGQTVNTTQTGEQTC